LILIYCCPGYKNTVNLKKFANFFICILRVESHDMEGQQVEQTAVNQIIPEAGAHILDLFNQRQDTRLVFHNYQFTHALVERVKEICREENLPERTREIAVLAAWFLKSGYLIDYQNFGDFSRELARKFLEERQYAETPAVLSCIRQVAAGEEPEDAAEQVLSDALQITTFIEDFSNRSALLHLEQEFILDRRPTRLEWANLQLQQLLQVRLHTHYAKATYEPALTRNIRELKEVVEKLRRRSEENALTGSGGARAFQGLEPDLPIRATQTFLRANYRNHINLSAIADNKANIMISVNSILISVLITFLSYRNIAETNPMVLLPVVIFLVSGLASLIFAVLSARPKVTNLNRDNLNKEEIKKNIVFFGNFVHLDLDQYEEAVDAVFHDSELLYGNMARDLYYLGKVLDKKYRYLSISYNIFMLGFIATVSTFLFALFR
jgi:hypothetical protein